MGNLNEARYGSMRAWRRLKVYSGEFTRLGNWIEIEEGCELRVIYICDMRKRKV